MKNIGDRNVKLQRFTTTAAVAYDTPFFDGNMASSPESEDMRTPKMGVKTAIIDIISEAIDIPFIAYFY